MAANYGYPAAGGGRGNLRAADADRDRVTGVLSTAFTEGRLSQDEYNARLDSAMTARTYAELDHIVSDLPGAWASLAPAAETVAPPVSKTNELAIASLACGLAQLAVGPVATIPAIVLGHMARGQIRRTGEPGAGLALAGLLLGWGAVIIAIIAVVAFIAVFSGIHGMPAPGAKPGGP